MGTGEFNAGANPAMDWHPIQRGIEIFLVASCYGNRDKLRPDGTLGSNADFTYLFMSGEGAVNTLSANLVHHSCWLNLVIGMMIKFYSFRTQI